MGTLLSFLTQYRHTQHFSTLCSKEREKKTA